ncbi:MAG: hypothetical protein OQL19_13990 [Gammaproteobacteria bacterium]|nr:hypothetical protein [Gammaproteobacteria bacterium]
MNQQHLEKLISTGYKLIAIETDSPEQTLNDFRPLIRESKAIYQWEKNVGLSRMEASHINIPNTKTPEMVLNHISQSKLYGIYLLIGFNNDLAKMSLQPTLNKIADDKSAKKIIIFIDNYFDYPHKLMSKLLIAQEPEVKERTSFGQIA